MREVRRSSNGKGSRASGFGMVAPLALLVLLVAGSSFLFASNPDRARLDRQAANLDTGVLPGLTVETASGRPHALVITSIRSQSEADRQGMKVGDRILAIDGRPVASIDQARRYLRLDKAGTVQLHFEHNRLGRDVSLIRKEA